MFCIKCGADNDNSSNYCYKCGNMIIRFATNKSPSEILPIETENNNCEANYYEIFVQKNYSYYLSSWKRLDAKDSKLSWNWAALLFSFNWFFYRGMYLWGCMIVVINMSLYFPFYSYEDVSPYITYGARILLVILCGLYGNYIYYVHAKKNISEVVTSELTNEEKELRTKDIGGIDIGAVLTSLGFAAIAALIKTLM